MRYGEEEVKYCNRARVVLCCGCIALLLIFYGLIEALAPRPKLRIKLDKDAELVALKLDKDGDGKISTSDIIAALAGDEQELEQLEQELVDQSLEFSIKLRGKDVDVKAAQEQATKLKSAYDGLEAEAADVVSELMKEKEQLEQEAIDVVQEEEATIKKLEDEKKEIEEALEEEEESFDETKRLYEDALQETLNREEEVEGLLAEAEAELIQEQMRVGEENVDEKLLKQVEELKKEKDLANAALKEQIAQDKNKIAIIETQHKAEKELNQKDLEETKELVEKLVAAKNQEDLEVEQMADEIEYLQEKLEKKGRLRRRRV